MRVTYCFSGCDNFEIESDVPPEGSVVDVEMTGHLGGRWIVDKVRRVIRDRTSMVQAVVYLTPEGE